MVLTMMRRSEKRGDIGARWKYMLKQVNVQVGIINR